MTGQVVSHYRILDQIGEGGMGVVYRAEDLRLGRRVALKFLPRDMTREWGALERFRREAETISSLNHPHVCTLYDVGEHDGRPFLVLELVEGRALKDILAAGPLPDGHAIKIAIHIADALDAAHALGIVHRDIKPGNVLVTPRGAAKLVDFGIATLDAHGHRTAEAVTRAQATAPGTWIGTLDYMAPERLRGEPADARSDLFSLGALLFEMVTGKVASSLSPSGVSNEFGSNEPLLRLVVKALDPDPELRYQTAKDFLADLRRLARDTTIRVPAIPANEQPSSGGAPRIAMFAVVFLALALALVAVWMGRQRSRPEEGSPPPGDSAQARLVVLPFENLTRRAEEDWLAGAFSDSVSAGLQPVASLILVPRERVVELYAAESRAESASLSADLARQLSQKLRVRYYVHGSYQRVGDDVRIVARLVDVVEDAIKAQETLTGPFAEVLRLEETLASRFATRLGPAPAFSVKIPAMTDPAATVATTPEPRPTVPTANVPATPSDLASYQLVTEARALYALGRFSDAAALLQKATTRDPRYALAWALRSKADSRALAPAAASGQPADAALTTALDEATTAVSLDSSAVEGQLALALAYRGLKDRVRWREAANRAASIDPRNAEAKIVLGDSLSISPGFGCPTDAQPSAAEATFREALRIDPLFGTGYVNLTTHLWWMGRRVDALASVEQGLAVQPGNVAIRRSHPFNTLFADRVDAAEALMTSRVDSGAALSPLEDLTRGYIALRRQRWDEAAARFAAPAAKQSLTNLALMLITAVAHFEAGRHDDGGTYLAHAIAVEPDCAKWAEHVPVLASYRETPAFRRAVGGKPQAAQAAAPSSTAPRHADEIEGGKLVDGGKHEDGLRLLDRAAVAYRRSGDRLGIARVRLKMSAASRALVQVDRALREAQEAHDLSASDPALRLSALVQLGRLGLDRGDLARADTWFRQALPMSQRAGDALTESSVLRALGRISDTRGLSREALDDAQRATSAADRSGNLPARVSSRVSVSVSLLALSRFDEALAVAQETFELSRSSPAPAVRAEALFNLAQAQGHVWNLERAASLWPQVIDSYRDANNPRGLALSTKQSVETSFARGEFERAVADGEKAVELLRQTNLQQLVPETMARLALSETRRGRLDAARGWSARARAEIATAPAARHVFVHNDLGLVAIELGDLTQAEADFTRVREVAREIGNVEYEWRSEWGLGRTMTAARNWTKAIASLERAIGTVERLRQTIPEAGMRATFMVNRVGPYESLVDATMGSSRAPDDEPARAALHVAERARSRALADLMAEARARASDPRLHAVRSQEVAFGQRFSSAGRRVAAASDDAARAAALAELAHLETEYEAMILKIRRENAGYAALAYPRALDASEIARLLAPDEALIEFLITDKRGYGWIVRHNAILGYSIPGQNELAPQMRFLQALVAANDEANLKKLGARLYDRLIKPAEGALGGVRRLVIVPDGALQRVPFALLRTGDRWLVERYVLALAPSATVLDRIRQAPIGRAERPLLGFAAPDAAPGHAALFDMAQRDFGTLTHASREVHDAASMVGARTSRTHDGPSATEETLKSADANAYRIVHFAAHAVVDEIVPRRSAVLLSPSGSDDGLLQISEIANLSLSADLVVLAACRSNVGRLVRGEGLLSLSRAFMHAGARAIVATSWKVGDRETAWLMREFYRGLAGGLAPDEALQRAQRRAIAAGGRNAAPGNWSAFLIIGDAHAPIVAPNGARSIWTLSLYVAVVLGVGAVVFEVRRRTRRSNASEE
jgi:CHAT domain-containing protein/TolB-like protein/Tfp pilus assembly protein PilF